MSTLIKNGTLVNEGVSRQGTITIGDDGRIASIGTEGKRVKPTPFGKALVEPSQCRPYISGLTADLSK